MHFPVGRVVTQLAPEAPGRRVHLQHSAHKPLPMNVLHVAVEVGFTGKILVTLGARKLHVEVDTLLVHFHVAFLVRLVATALKVTDEFKRVWHLLLTLTGLEIPNMVSSQLPVVEEPFAAFLTIVLLGLVMNYVNVLSKIGESFKAVGTGFVLFVWILNTMNVLSVLVENCFLIKYFVAKVAGI